MCSLYKRGKKGAGKVYPSSIYKEYNKTKGKGVKSCGKVCSSLYIEYIIKGTCGKVRKVRDKGKVRERVFPFCI